MASSRWSQRQRTGSRGRWETREGASQSWVPETSLLRVSLRRAPPELPRPDSLGRRLGLKHRRHLATFPGGSRGSARRPHCLCAPHSSPPTSPPPAHPGRSRWLQLGVGSWEQREWEGGGQSLAPAVVLGSRPPQPGAPGAHPHRGSAGPGVARVGGRACAAGTRDHLKSEPRPRAR